MRKEDTDFITINMPRPRVFAQESVSNIKKKSFKKRVQTPRNSSIDFLVKYKLPNNSFLRDNAFEKLFLPYRLYEKNMAKMIRKHYSAIELEDKYKILYTDLRKRLHVDDPPDDVQAVTDIDEDYFRYIISHRRTGCTPLYKSLIFLFHKQIRTTQEIGYRRDYILNMKTKHRREVLEHQDNVEMYIEQVKQFDLFISEDYAKSIAFLKKSETLHSNLIDEKISELKKFASKQFSIQSKLIGIDYLYSQQQKYGRFLYYLSPPTWRAQHRDFANSVEIEAKGFDLGTSSEEDTFNVIFEKMKIECVNGFVKPALYFSRPEELMNVFESTERQLLHSFSHGVQIQPHKDMLQKKGEDLNRKIQIDTAYIDIVVGDIEKSLQSDEERASELKARFMKILNDSFHDYVAAPDAIKLKVNLEWCFEKIFGEKPNTSIRSTAKALEDMYMEYRYKLESFSHKENNQALKQSVAEEKHMLKRAYRATRELRLFDQLEKSLMLTQINDNVGIAPPPVVTRTRKQKAPQTKPMARHSSQRDLSLAQIEYLHLFTEWTEKEDPTKYLHFEQEPIAKLPTS